MARAWCESPLRTRFAKRPRGSQAPTRECTVPLEIAPSVVSNGATHEILFVLEICSELMLPLASLTQCFARSAPECPSANPNPRKLQPWLYFQQHGGPDSSFAPPGDAN